ncbi:MAG: protein kinase, partial [Gemmatimonadetes bacterium]|nr:protein kinase [Gemmatimonadota bacterium]
YAHRNNVIHRDIKPENILLHDGRPMVADFGIALALSAAAGGRMTETGMSLGTPHYMSPEQATAEKDITARSDVYSLGSVLYEMLTGEPPHTGGSAQQIIMKIVTEEPQAVTELRKSVPANVAAAVAKALEKLAADRFESAAAFSAALANPAFSTRTARAPSAGARGRSSYWNPLSIGLAVVALAAVLANVWTWRRPAEQIVARHALALPGTNGGAPWKMAISKDGSRFAWQTGGVVSGAVWTKSRGALDATAFPHPAYGLALSPDGEELVWLWDEELRISNLASGDVRTLFSGAATVGWGEMVWSEDGYVYFTLASRVIGRVRSTGGPVEEVTSLDADTGSADAGHRVLQMLPGGRLLFLRQSVGQVSSSSVAAWDIETGQITDVATSDYAFYMPPGYLISVTDDGTIVGARFDLESLRATSDPVPIGANARESFLGVSIAASESGLVLYVAGRSAFEGRLSRVDHSGIVNPLPIGSGRHRGVRVSPDGRWLAYGSFSGTVFVHDLVVGSSRQIVPDWIAFDPVWSPGGRAIGFHANRDAKGELDVTGWKGFVLDLENLDGPPRPVFAHDIATGPSSWRSGGKVIGPTDEADLVAILLDGDSINVKPFVDAPWAENLADLSPDGKWAAYVDHREGIPEVWVRSFPDPGTASLKVSEGWATEPRWAPDGRILYYWRDGPELIAAQLRTEPQLVVEELTVVLRDIDYAFTFCCHSNYDPLPDGSGFYMSVREGGSAAEVILIEGLISELREKLGN